MIDPATSWFEMAKIPNKTAAEIADITEKNWFTRYPLPQWIVFDRGTKFMAKSYKMYQKYYDLKSKPITTRNPHSNAIIKQIHKTIGNIIRTFYVSNIVNNNPCSGILAATMFSVSAIYHTTLQASTKQIVFDRYAILNIKHVSDWEHIWQHKQLRMNRNNKRDNMHRNNHQYKAGEKF